MKRLTAIVLFCAVLRAAPATAFYCGSAVIHEGQHKFEVLQKCGEPAFADSHIVYVPNPGYLPPSREAYQSGFGYYSPPTVPVIVDEWVYNFGPTQMMPRLLFRDGVLRAIRLQGYGGN